MPTLLVPVGIIRPRWVSGPHPERVIPVAGRLGAARPSPHAEPMKTVGSLNARPVIVRGEECTTGAIADTDRGSVVADVAKLACSGTLGHQAADKAPARPRWSARQRIGGGLPGRIVEGRHPTPASSSGRPTAVVMPPPSVVQPQRTVRSTGGTAGEGRAMVRLGCGERDRVRTCDLVVVSGGGPTAVNLRFCSSPRTVEAKSCGLDGGRLAGQMSREPVDAGLGRRQPN
jgi:hypothetical protein